MTRSPRSPLLFDVLPALRERVPWIDLGLERSPVQRLAGLGAELGHDGLWIKRDNRISDLYGGNKGRKLAFLLADALAQGSETVIALGTTGSHQCVANAIFGRQVGLRPISAMTPQPVVPAVRRNLLIGLLFGAEILFAPDEETLGARVLERLRADRRAYLVAPGGCTPLGNLGFVEAGLELAEQVERGELPEPDRIFLAGASTGSAAGLGIGLRLAGLASRVHVVQASAARWCTPEILARNEAELWSLLGPVPRPRAGLGVHFDASCFGPGYGIPTAEGEDALHRMRTQEGIELDACYTAKAFAGLVRYLREEPSARRETLLFWHTANARDFSDALAARDYRELPRELHPIFEEPLPDFASVDAHRTPPSLDRLPERERGGP